MKWHRPVDRENGGSRLLWWVLGIVATIAVSAVAYEYHGFKGDVAALEGQVESHLEAAGKSMIDFSHLQRTVQELKELQQKHHRLLQAIARRLRVEVD